LSRGIFLSRQSELWRSPRASRLMLNSSSRQNGAALMEI
jgi:hypothetical protein